MKYMNIHYQSCLIIVKLVLNMPKMPVSILHIQFNANDTHYAEEPLADFISFF